MNWIGYTDWGKKRIYLEEKSSAFQVLETGIWYQKDESIIARGSIVSILIASSRRNSFFSFVLSVKAQVKNILNDFTCGFILSLSYFSFLVLLLFWKVKSKITFRFTTFFTSEILTTRVISLIDTFNIDKTAEMPSIQWTKNMGWWNTRICFTKN